MFNSVADYLDLGWKIFPCHSVRNGMCSCGDPACKHQGKHPRIVGGFKNATNDKTQLDAWWKQWPDANWAVATGREAGVVVVDIDPSSGGFESFDEYEQMRVADGSFSETLIGVTGSGGLHIYLKYPENDSIGRRIGWLKGVDILGDNGYAMLPPSNHISGTPYAWKNWGHSLGEAPEDFIKAVSSQSSSKSSLGGGNTLPTTDELLDGLEEGSRDDNIFRMASRLRRQLGDNRNAVTVLVLHAAANAHPPFPVDEALAKIDQAFKQDHTEAEIFSDSDDEASAEDDPIYRLTDMGNRDRFVRAYGDDYRFVTGLGWHTWTDIGWVQTDDLDPHRKAQAVPGIIRQDAERVDDLPTKARFMRWANDSESSGRIASIMTLARGHETIKKSADAFNAEQHLLACRNGMLNLRTGIVRPFTRDDLFTKNTGIVYEPGFVIPQLQAFLEEATGGDQDLQEYLQMAAGYTLTGSIAEECFFIVSGPTQTGKTTFTSALETALGSYGDVTSAETFMKRYGKEVPREELVKFMGTRMITTEELPEGERFDDALLKRITGGGRLSARLLYEESASFMPMFKLWMATNHDPVTSDSAMFRRIKRVPFMYQIPEARRDRSLKKMLADPNYGGKAMLVWAAEGARKYYEAGKLETPLAVLAATSAYQQEQDTFAHFLNETFNVSSGNEIKIQQMFAMYSEWCKVSNERPGRRPQFITKLKERHIEVSTKDNGDQYTVGLGIRADNFANPPMPFT